MRRARISDAGDRIALHEPFNAGSLWANGLHADAGQLPDEWAARLRTDTPTYVVYSYRTPIAWVLATGEVVSPPVGYSVTTSRHQRMTRTALARSL